MTKHITILGFLFLAFTLKAQEVPKPAAAQSRMIILKGGRIHTGDGKIIENGAIAFNKGIITKVGSASDEAFQTSDANIIDVKDKEIYPGLIALASNIGLIEIGAVRATNDKAEVGNMNPNARTVIAYNTDSRVTPTIRFNGVLAAQIIPEGGRISGTSAVVQLDAWNWEDALLKEDGIWLNWPSMYSYSGWWAEPGSYEKNKDYPAQTREIASFLQEAKSYSLKDKPAEINLKFESMRHLFDGKYKLYINVGSAKEMLEAIDLCESFGIKPVLHGAYDSYLIADLLAKKQIEVILNKEHALPSRIDDDIEQNYKTPAILEKAGVKYCIGLEGYYETRNLAFQAGTAVAQGLDKEKALASITKNAAEILGMGDKMGTLESGKWANILVCKGDLLDMKGNILEHAFIQGREISLENKQKELFEKFSDKYGIK